MSDGKRIKMFVVDLDDTLIGLDLRISPANRRAITRVKRAGILTTIATGRTFQTTQPFAHKLGITLPLICYHGALVRTENKVYIERMLPEHFYFPLIQFAARHRLQVCFYVSHHNVIYFNRPLDKFGKEYLDKVEQVKEITLVNLKSYTIPRTPIKCMMIGSQEKIARVAEIAQKRWHRKMYVTISRPTLLEFLNPDISKGKAVTFLAEKYGVALRNVAGIGDSYNDISMFRTVGTSIAVRNAPRKVEKAADYVVARYDEDGVAEAVKKFVVRDEK